MIHRPGHQDVGDMFDGMLVDLFAGGGGASVGIEGATGRAVDLAVNHDPEAVAMHRINHPHTRHLTCDVWEVDPIEATGGRPVDGLWASPDCTHHSKARGKRPIREAGKKSRALAWVVVRWAKKVRPRVIWMENVEEFKDWGPCVGEYACPDRAGQSFEAFVGWLRKLGYAVEWRELRACDYGAPTIRKRLYLVARCDGESINWPEVTHGISSDEVSTGGVAGGDGAESVNLVSPAKAGDRILNGVPDHGGASGGRGRGSTKPRRRKSRGSTRTRLKPYRTAAECIDWSIPCPSIFMTPEEAKAYYEATGVRVKRPLADKTMARIANGLRRYVLEAAEPFIVSIANYGGNGAPSRSSDEPLSTVTANPKGGHHAMVTPYVVSVNHGDSGGRRSHGIEEPMKTVQASARGGEAIVTPYMVPRYGERPGQEPRSRGVDQPGPTITPTANGGSLVAPVLSKYHSSKSGEHRCGELGEPVKTLDTSNRVAVVAAFIAKHYGGVVGSDARTPLGTTTTTGSQNQLVAAHLTQFYGTNEDRPRVRDLRDPAPTAVGRNTQTQMVASFLAPYYGSGSGQTGRDLREPSPTTTTKERLQLVTVMLNGEPYVIVDIGMRMLSPRELYRAQGFGDEYVIDQGIGADGELMNMTKSAQVRMCGNSVCPAMSRALVESNLDALDRGEAVA